ncbi:MAG TPA: glycerophosphodiester phosphodiesterase family protein [Polyangiaceae bacterium]|nr:glycerophosphodiester phosphodiesterase family protein [Polyangiaceae bacterium]
MSVWQSVAPFVVGHRGGRGEGWPPENTLEAFERARQQGARAVELDVRTSAEGEAVVFHDPTMTRMTSGRDSRRVVDIPLGQLRAVDLGAGSRIPTLVDVLAWARSPGIGVNVEVKYDVPNRTDVVRAAARAMRQCDTDVLISSFDPFMLAAVAALAPAVPRALLTHAGQPRWAGAVQALLRPPLVSAMHLERTQVGSGSIAGKYRALRIGIWTVNSQLEAVDFVRRGAAWIISDMAGDVVEALRGGCAPV